MCDCSLPPGSVKEPDDIDSSSGISLRVRDAIYHGQQYVYTPSSLPLIHTNQTHHYIPMRSNR